MKSILLFLWAGLFTAMEVHAVDPNPVVQVLKDGPSIQKALDVQPGRMLFLPAGDYEIAQSIRLTGTHVGIYGPGHIIQANPDAAIIEINDATDVQLRDLVLSRPEGKMDTKQPAIRVMKSRDVVLSNLQISDNRSDFASVYVQECALFQMRDCLVQNYSRIAIDDRTKNPLYGYAFNCIDGTGVMVKKTKGVRIEGNRIIELAMVPTPELKDKFHLGTVIKKNAERGALINQASWDAGYVNIWQQGAALQVTSPETTDAVQILSNYIENAAQGIDLHADHVIVSQNIVNNAAVGIKAMHGARNVLITGNQFLKNDLWSIGLMPGSASHYAGQPVHAVERPEENEANVDGHSIIANNIISDFGYGNTHWIWGDAGTPFKFDNGQTPANPPLRDVVLQGNIVYDTGHDQVIVDGKPKVEPPRYKYAVTIAGGADAPQGLHFTGNLFDPGTEGVSNLPMAP